MKLLTRVPQQVRQVLQTFAVLEPGVRAFVGERPVVSVVAKECGIRLGPCLGYGFEIAFERTLGSRR